MEHKRPARKSKIFELGSILLITAYLLFFSNINLGGDSVDTWKEECEHEGCTSGGEEMKELYNSYKEECMHEGCTKDGEEINELSGGSAYNNSMFQGFLSAGWVIRSEDFSGSIMDNAAWVYTGANYSGNMYQLWEPKNQATSSFINLSVSMNDQVSSIKLGSSAYIATYNNVGYSGAQLVVWNNQSSLGSPFNDAISSATVNLWNNPYVGTPPPNVPLAVNNIVNYVGDPASTTLKASRSTAGVPSTFCTHLDIGGEGYKTCDNVISGWKQAMNINATRINNCSTPGAIPNLIYVNDWTSSPPYPVTNGFADYITMQGAPLTSWNVSEMTRALRKGGSIALWIDDNRYSSAINQLKSNLKGSVIYDAYDEFGGEANWSKTLIVDGR